MMLFISCLFRVVDTHKTLQGKAIRLSERLYGRSWIIAALTGVMIFRKLLTALVGYFGMKTALDSIELAEAEKIAKRC